VWTLLADLGIRPEATHLYIESVDGFFETVVMADLVDGRSLFVYGMGGETLPVEHGFPLRIYIPHRYGMKQPKWITRIEAVTEWQPGYWVVRGWSQEAWPQTASAIDTVAVNSVVNGLVPIGGIAWAGTRGIQRVEVQVNDGPWQIASLRTPPLSPLTWVQWRYEWPATPGQHAIRVRATDGTGAVQTANEQPPRPDGATGYHTRTITI
ncbi:MAG: molybdopterin-dependent oxidoreductase, partial [Ardenticatenaceae bacterium]